VSGRRPEVSRLIGQVHWHAGARERALGWWRRSLAEGAALGARPDVGRTYLVAGRWLAEGGPELSVDEHLDAQACLERAHATFTDLDLKWDLERASQVRP
jgi:hypothetical protein